MISPVQQYRLLQQLNCHNRWITTPTPTPTPTTTTATIETLSHLRQLVSNITSIETGLNYHMHLHPIHSVI